MSRDRAMKISTVNRCAEVLSNSMGVLPLYIMNEKSKERLEEHRLGRVLWGRANEAMTSFDYNRLMLCNQILRGNAYAWICRDGRTGYSKGMAAAWADNHPLGESGSAISSSYQDWVRESNTDTLYTPHAAGLDRVPYDNYAALLHEGERVLTAREAREQDRKTSSPIQITVTGNWSVRTDEDVDAIAAAILRKVELAQRGGVR